MQCRHHRGVQQPSWWLRARSESEREQQAGGEEGVAQRQQMRKSRCERGGESLRPLRASLASCVSRPLRSRVCLSRSRVCLSRSLALPLVRLVGVCVGTRCGPSSHSHNVFEATNTSSEKTKDPSSTIRTATRTRASRRGVGVRCVPTPTTPTTRDAVRPSILFSVHH